MTGLRQALLVMLMLLPGLVRADIGVAEFDSPEQLSRYQTLIAELRCLVCQNQNLADSNADLANDLKDIVQQKIKAGETDGQIMAFMTERYGDFVLYRPPFKATTFLLWAGPALFLLLGLFIVLAFVRKTRSAPATVSDKDHQRAREILQQNNPE